MSRARPLKDYEQTFEQFWRPLVLRRGRLSLDLLKRELHDYHTGIREVGEVYVEITGGRFSKPNTSAAFVLDAHAEWCTKLAEVATAARALRRLLREFIRAEESRARTSYRVPGTSSRWRAEWKRAEPVSYHRVERAAALLRRAV